MFILIKFDVLHKEIYYKVEINVKLGAWWRILINLLKNIVFSFGKVVNYGNEITHSFIQWEEF